SAKTSDQGNYLLREVQPGTYTLIVSKDGYVRQVRPNVVVGAGQLVEVDVALAGDFTDLEEYVVQDILALGGGSEDAQLQLRFESPSLMDSISADLIGRAGASDAAGALRLVAGASLQNGKSAVIRGLPDRYVSSQLNGVRLPSADEDKRAVELDQFPAAVIESVQVTKTFTPDQQGDASGGAVDVRLKGVPDEPLFVQWRIQTSHNTQATGRSNFLGYEGGGVHFFGRDGGDRDPQIDLLGQNWDGAVGVRREQAPVDFKWSGAFGGKTEIADGVRLGGFVSVFYEHKTTHYTNGRDESWWVDVPGDPMTPQTTGSGVLSQDFQTRLYDVTRSTQAVQLGSLATVGLETDNHAVNFAWLNSLTSEDSATLAEDTRGKAYYFPGYDPNNTSTPGHAETNAAPYLRLETLQYSERMAGTLQLNGRHTLKLEPGGAMKSPELDWTASKSSATKTQPDKRVFGSRWDSTFGGTWSPFKPAANFTIGNLQRIWKEVEEDSTQYATNLKLPFEVSSELEGYLKFGFFEDKVERTYDQDTFSNFNDNSTFSGPFDQYWSASFPFENHPITAAEIDVDYRGEQQIDAWYAMADVPIADGLHLIGGIRFENTAIDIVNDAESDVVWFPPGSSAPAPLGPGEADVAFRQEDALPALAMVYEVMPDVTLRAAYSETIARQTFKELTPILQQEYLGGPVFVGNPELQMSALRNYDLRADWTPNEGGLLSLSWFHKDMDDPIEYVQRVASVFDYTSAVNYPEGKLDGIELEVRQDLAQLTKNLDGLGVGLNATWIESEVTLTQEEIDGFNLPSIQAPMTTRDMTNAPESIYNAYLTWESESSGTRLGLFYTLTGDTLVAGAGQANDRFIPNVYQVAYDSLNFSLTQRLSEHVDFQFQAKNLTDPDIEQVYRSPYIGSDVTKISYTRGIDYSIGIGGRVTF
ncbi:MAG: TonB-dependent receptor plug domain-containing protein, partial [Planctomycetota bacterium]